MGTLGKKSKAKSSHSVRIKAIKCRIQVILAAVRSMHCELANPVDGNNFWDPHDIGWLSVDKLAIEEFQPLRDMFQAAITCIAHSQRHSVFDDSPPDGFLEGDNDDCSLSKVRVNNLGSALFQTCLMPF